jgi:hypothetical protein
MHVAALVIESDIEDMREVLRVIVETGGQNE